MSRETQQRRESGVATFHQFVQVLGLQLEANGAPKSNGPNAQREVNRLAYALSSRDGLWLEFGVWKGKTIHEMATANPNGTIYGFDSFEGLPEKWRDSSHKRFVHLKGHFSLGGGLPTIKSPNVRLIKGWFSESLPPFLEAFPKDTVSFLHVDCDIYSSSIFVLRTLQNQLRNGTIILFDDLINYPEYQSHELLALWEFIQENRERYSIRVLSGVERFEKFPTTDKWPQAVAVQLITHDSDIMRARPPPGDLISVRQTRDEASFR